MTRAGHERSLDLSPPAKRQRRLTFCSSSDEDESNHVPSVEEQTEPQSIRTSHLSTRSSTLGKSTSAIARVSSRPSVPTTKVKTATKARTGSKASSSSPEKTNPQKYKRQAHIRRPSKDVSPSKTRSLHNFFQPASEEQRWSSQKFETRTTTLGSHSRQNQKPTVVEEDDDFIEDDYDTYDEIFTQQMNATSGNTESPATGSAVTAGRLQQPQNQEPSSTRAPSGNDLVKKRPVTASKRFLLTSKPQIGERDSETPAIAGDDTRPWAQRFAPATLEELAMHKKKVGDVKAWLEASLAGRNKQRLLVLRGPAGCGKTSTISLLSRSLHFDVLEWKNPTVAEAALGGSGAQFEEFLGRGNKFASLDLLGATTVSASETERGAPDVDPNRRILLIEEFPVLTSRNSAALAAFRSSLQRYLVDGFPSQQRPPVVMIVSETLLSSSSSTSDNFTAHRLLGPILYNHPATTVIEVNSIAPTFMLKALNLVLEKEARNSKRTKVPGPAVLKAVSEIGDVRSAISALEFLCLKNEGGAQWSSSLAAKTKRTARSNIPLTSMEKESLELITQRETSLGIFHAVGKVVYNKRDDASAVEANEILPSPPEHLRQFHRPKVSQVSVNSLLDETGTDVQTFICALHENYPPSCDGASFAEHLDGCIEALSDSDILTAGSRRSPGTRSGPVAGLSLMGAATDVLRQDEIAFHTAVRGLLFALPYPVKRHLPAAAKGHSGRPGGAHKMFFPALLRQWSDYEEAEGLIDLWMKRSLDPSSRPRLRSDGSTATPKPEGVRSWKSLKVGTIHSTDDDGDYKSHRDIAQSIAVTVLSREDMLLYQLPHLARITRSESERRELEKITAFGGIQNSSEPLDNAMVPEEYDVPPTEVYTDAPEHVRSPGNPRRVLKGQGSIHAFGPKLPPSVDEEEKLVLSDDDIED